MKSRFISSHSNLVILTTDQHSDMNSPSFVLCCCLFYVYFSLQLLLFYLETDTIEKIIKKKILQKNLFPTANTTRHMAPWTVSNIQRLSWAANKLDEKLNWWAHDIHWMCFPSFIVFQNFKTPKSNVFEIYLCFPFFFLNEHNKWHSISFIFY